MPEPSSPRGELVGRPAAWLAGFVLPIEVVGSVSRLPFDLVSVGVLLVVAAVFRSMLSPSVARWIRVGIILLAGAVVVRFAFSVSRSEVPSVLNSTGFKALGLAAAALVAYRVAAHRLLLAGFLAGATVSASVSLLQAADLPAPRAGNFDGTRFPGLAFDTTRLTWQLAMAIVIGVTVIITSRDQRYRMATSAQVIVCGLGLVVCGAQGGVVGLIFAAVVIVAFARPRPRLDRLVPALVAVVAGVALVSLLLVGSGLGARSIDGLFGDPDKGYENEVARLDAASAGARALAEHPLVGPGEDAFLHAHPVLPHFLPLSLGVTAGVTGLLLGAALVGYLGVTILKGPVGRSPSAWLGLGLLSIMAVQTLTLPDGPFVRGRSITLLLVAVAACRGEAWPDARCRHGVQLDEPLAPVPREGRAEPSSPPSANRRLPSEPD